MTAGTAYETIVWAIEGPLGWITLNRPEKLNAISKTMLAELNDALDQAERDDDVRVILIRGEGRAFSAGFDLAPDGAAGRTPDEAAAALRQELRNDFDLIMRFWESPKATIAAVHGYCLGGAMELAMACDITLAAENSRFGEPEVKFGSGIVALLAPWLCGPKRAKELLLTGNDRVDARQAEAWGLVNRVVTDDDLLAEARELARSIARNDPVAVKLTKQAINDSYKTAGMRKALEDALDVDITIELTETEESRQFNEILKKEGMRAAIAWRDRRLG